MANAMDMELQGNTLSVKATGKLTKEMYEESFEKWAKVFETYPVLIDSVTAEELNESVTEYRLVLERLVEPFPDPFVLDFVFARTGTGEYAQQLEAMSNENRPSSGGGSPNQ